MAKKKLGIDALFQSSVPRAAAPRPEEGEYRQASIANVRPNPRQPRRHFDERALAQLTASIRSQGVLQPLLVRESGEAGQYELIAGERRLRAAREAGLASVPVRVVAFDDDQSLVAAVVENLQREDLNPIEEAEGYLELLRTRLEPHPEFDPYRDPTDPLQGPARVLRALNNRMAGNSKDNVVLTLEPVVGEVFDLVGKVSWQSFVTHRLPLLTLPDDVAAALRANEIPYTKARIIARATAERLGTDETGARRVRRDLIEQAVTEGLSVRGLQAEVERLVSGRSRPERKTPAGKAQKPRAQGFDGRVQELIARLAALDADELGPDRRREVVAAVERLLGLI